MTTTEPMTDNIETEDKIEDLASRPDPDLKLEQGMKLSQRDKSALNALVRMHFKTLLEEITDEEHRALSTVAERVADRRRQEAREADAFKNQMGRIIELANERIRMLIDEHRPLFESAGNWDRPSMLSTPSIYQRGSSDAAAMQQALERKIRSRATSARLVVKRRETENLRAIQLAVLDAKFLATVAALPQRDDVFETSDILQLTGSTAPPVEVIP